MKQQGNSLIESLLIIAMVGIIVVLIGNLPNAINLMSSSKHLSIVRGIAAKQIEDKRAISYANLVNDNSAITDSRILLLPSGSGNVVVQDCSAQICTNSESLKQVIVTINWKDNNKSQTISVNTFIGQGGLH